MVSASGEVNMTGNEVDADDFESQLDSGKVGGGVTVEPGQVIGKDDYGADVVYEVDTSPRVADVMGQGIKDPPFGEEV